MTDLKPEAAPGASHHLHSHGLDTGKSTFCFYLGGKATDRLFFYYLYPLAGYLFWELYP